MAPVIAHDGIAPEDVDYLWEHYRADPVLCYVNGLYAWSPAQEAQFARKARISVEAGQPDAAKVARILDVERFDAGPADVAPFCHAREAAGHADATIYASLASIVQMGPAIARIVPRWLVAWWWQLPGAPTQEQVYRQLPPSLQAVIPIERIWGCQFRSAPMFDSDVIYGPQDWSR